MNGWMNEWKRGSFVGKLSTVFESSDKLDICRDRKLFLLLLLLPCTIFHLCVKKWSLKSQKKKTNKQIGSTYLWKLAFTKYHHQNRCTTHKKWLFTGKSCQEACVRRRSRDFYIGKTCSFRKLPLLAFSVKHYFVQDEYFSYIKSH